MNRKVNANFGKGGGGGGFGGENFVVGAENHQPPQGF